MCPLGWRHGAPTADMTSESQAPVVEAHRHHRHYWCSGLWCSFLADHMHSQAIRSFIRPTASTLFRHTCAATVLPKRCHHPPLRQRNYPLLRSKTISPFFGGKSGICAVALFFTFSSARFMGNKMTSENKSNSDSNEHYVLKTPLDGLFKLR